MPEILAWWLGAIALAYVLARAAGWYMDRLPITDADESYSRVDDDLNEQVAATIVASRLDRIDQRILDEDEEVAQLDALWDLPAFKEPA